MSKLVSDVLNHKKLLLKDFQHCVTPVLKCGIVRLGQCYVWQNFCQSEKFKYYLFLNVLNTASPRLFHMKVTGLSSESTESQPLLYLGIEYYYC